MQFAPAGTKAGDASSRHAASAFLAAITSTMDQNLTPEFSLVPSNESMQFAHFVKYNNIQVSK